MRILLLNPPHPSIGSRIPEEHLPPLGLLSVGGPLIDAGHDVRLLDAEFGPMSGRRIVEEVRRWLPNAILVGHSGSTSGHPTVCRLTRKLRLALPGVWIVYGGPYPTYHWREIMESQPQIDFIVRGEGEETAVRLMGALERGEPLETVRGIVYRSGLVPGLIRLTEGCSGGMEEISENAPAPLIANLDAYPVGWELIDHRRYTYWGRRRAVVVQFSRGCPHQCTYCSQRVFWERWRHRDPVRFAKELARLHREQGVEVINFADENPTARREPWQAFLEALIRENVPLTLVGSTRAGDIVRDRDILHLYKRAGVVRWLMGIETTDESTLQRIRKGSTTSTDREAIRLLREHGIISMAAFVMGFAREKDRDYWRLLRQLIAYDPDQIQGLYATPHAWTEFARQESKRWVIQRDLSLWDYKHQVLESPHVPNWRLLGWMKFIEAVSQLRPRSLRRLLAHPDAGFRAGMRWYYQIGRKVWPYELWNWLFRDGRVEDGPTVAELLNLRGVEQGGRPLPAVEAGRLISELSGQPAMNGTD